MTVEKRISVDLIEVVGYGVQVRTRTSMVEDDQEISASYHRYVLMPGECGQDEDPRVKAICAAIHTQEVVSAYRAEQDRIQAEQEAVRIKAEQEAAAAKEAAEAEAATQSSARQASFDQAVADAVRKTLMGGQ